MQINIKSKTKHFFDKHTDNSINRKIKIIQKDTAKALQSTQVVYKGHHGKRIMKGGHSKDKTPATSTWLLTN